MTVGMNAELSCIEISKFGEIVAMGKDSVIYIWEYSFPEKETILSNPIEKSTEETKIHEDD